MKPTTLILIGCTDNTMPNAFNTETTWRRRPDAFHRRPRTLQHVTGSAVGVDSGQIGPVHRPPTCHTVDMLTAKILSTI